MNKLIEFTLTILVIELLMGLAIWPFIVCEEKGE